MTYTDHVAAELRAGCTHNGQPCYCQVGLSIALRRPVAELFPTDQEDPVTSTDPAVNAAIKAIKRFSWDNYGLDDTDPNSEYAEWVEPLAEQIIAAVREATRLLTAANETEASA